MNNDGCSVVSVKGPRYSDFTRAEKAGKVVASNKGALWPFRKNKADLTSDEAALLDRLFAHSPSLKLAYDFREALTTIFDQDHTKEQATSAITAWRDEVADSKLSCFDPFLNTLDAHLDLITNYFLRRLNSGFVEGLNNKIKVLKRRCFGS